MAETRNGTPPSTSRTRLHTPPAPRWGAKDDSWTPFTPRRSSRVAAKRHSSPLSPESPTRQMPSSPTKLSKRPSTIIRAHKQRRESPVTSDDELHSTRMTKESLFGSSTNGTITSMLPPTPAKTPRSKRQLPKEVLSSASKVLFHSRLANADEAMPSPKKSRKSKAFSLNPFVDESAGSLSQKIEVYEDSKERVPTTEQDEDNPFVSKAPNPGQSNSSRSRRRVGREARTEEASGNDDGLIYVFRGKKVFRKFEDTESNDEDNLSDLEIQRRAGVSPIPRMGRTTIKPRILFPTEEQRKAEEADEEALTDIDVPSPSTRKSAVNIEPSESEVVAADSSETACVVKTSIPINTDESTEPTNKHLAHPKKPRAPSPFDKWSRVKPSLAAPVEKSRKRGASPLEQSSKRVRSNEQ